METGETHRAGMRFGDPNGHLRGDCRLDSDRPVQYVSGGELRSRPPARGETGQPFHQIDHAAFDDDPRLPVHPSDRSGGKTITRGGEIAVQIVNEANALRRDARGPAPGTDLAVLVLEPDKEWATANGSRLAMIRQEPGEAFDENGIE